MKNCKAFHQESNVLQLKQSVWDCSTGPSKEFLRKISSPTAHIGTYCFQPWIKPELQREVLAHDSVESAYRVQGAEFGP